MKHRLIIISKDTETIEEIQSLLELFPDWEMKVYTSVEKAWIDFIRKEPDLSIVDLDFTGTNETTRPSIDVETIPLFVFLSSNNKSSYDAIFAVQAGALDYLQKPVKLDELVSSISIAQGPVDDDRVP